jgi:hypothetical protein
VEELASYYQKLGYNGIPVKIDIPKNLVWKLWVYPKRCTIKCMNKSIINSDFGKT